MSEFSEDWAVEGVQDVDEQWSPEPTDAEPVEATGHVDVDTVVESLSTLDDLPVADHVAVFEQAHESLRRTLAGAGPDIKHENPAAVRS